MTAAASNDPLPALIVGAGPAGLATAACLKQRGVDALVLEAGPALGQSWRQHYERLHLHPISMLFVPEAELRGWLSGVRVDAIDHLQSGPILSGTVYATLTA